MCQHNNMRKRCWQVDLFSEWTRETHKMLWALTVSWWNTCMKALANSAGTHLSMKCFHDPDCSGMMKSYHFCFDTSHSRFVRRPTGSLNALGFSCKHYVMGRILHQLSLFDSSFAPHHHHSNFVDKADRLGKPRFRRKRREKIPAGFALKKEVELECTTA